MAGRRPTPTALKIVTGNPGKRKINRREPKPEAGVPIPPDHLSDRARQAWFGLLPILEGMSVLAVADSLALERLCECYAEVIELSLDIRKHGRTQAVKTKSDDVMERQRPQVAMLADADRRFKSYLVEFGLSPAARSKVNAQDDKDEPQTSSYFGQGDRLRPSRGGGRDCRGSDGSRRLPPAP